MVSPGRGGFMVIAVFILMVVHDFDVACFAVPPLKADAVSVVDANTVLAGPVVFEGFERQSWALEIMQRSRRVEDGQFAISGLGDGDACATAPGAYLPPELAGVTDGVVCPCGFICIRC